jgi:hypothetical protein
MTPTPKYTVIEVARSTAFNQSQGMSEYRSLVLIVEMGHVVQVETKWFADASRLETTYHWCAPKSVGLTTTWVAGDPVGGKANPWIRKDPNIKLDSDTGFPHAHRSGVEHFMEIARHQPDAMGTPSFLGKQLMGMFAFGSLHSMKPPVQERTKRTKYTSGILTMNDLEMLEQVPELSKHEMLQMASDTLKALSNKTNTTYGIDA